MFCYLTYIDLCRRNMHTQQSKYRTRAIISRGLYIFYPIFHCGLYCRVVYNAERLLFCDSFFIQKLISVLFAVHLLHLQPIVVCTLESGINVALRLLIF